jgi:hypothetical protein
MANTQSAAPRTIHLQAVGNVPAIPAADLKVGDQLIWNYGRPYEVAAERAAFSPSLMRLRRACSNGRGTRPPAPGC